VGAAGGAARGGRAAHGDVTADAFRAGLVRTVEHNEYPLLHPSSVPMVALAALARGQGAKVC
jgi:hypothetical protein